MEIISRKEAKEKGLKYYFTGKPCKHGHVSKRSVFNRNCCECSRQHNRQWQEANREKELERKKKHYYANREQELERRKQYYQTNREHKLEQQKKYYQANKEQIAEYKQRWKQENKTKLAERQRERYRNDPLFKTLLICRSMLRRVLSQSGTEKKSRTFEVIGYSNIELKAHIEFLFLPGMSWDNYGEWHIDHIYPVSRFLSDGVKDLSTINSLSNLAPMWSEHNLAKGDKPLDEWLDEKGPESDEWKLYRRLLDT